MNVYLAIFLGMAIAALIVVAASAVPVLVRATKLQRRLRVLDLHPTLVALREAQTVGVKMRGMRSALDVIQARAARIGEASAQLLATSALLRLEVDRVGFATRLLLETLVPTLRGSMSD